MADEKPAEKSKKEKKDKKSRTPRKKPKPEIAPREPTNLDEMTKPHLDLQGEHQHLEPVKHAEWIEPPQPATEVE